MGDRLKELLQLYSDVTRDARTGGMTSTLKDIDSLDISDEEKVARKQEFAAKHIGANIAGMSLGVSANTLGILPGIVTEGAGLAGGHLGYELGEKADEKFGTKGIAPTLSIAGGLGGGIGAYRLVKPKYHHSIPYRQKQSSIAANSSSGTELVTPAEAIEELKKGRAMAGSFFKQPVVKESYAHNQKLAKRLGLNLPDRPADISEMVTRPVKVGGNTGDNEIANVAQGYYGDPNATMNFQGAKRPKSEGGAAARHESMHLGYYSAPVRPEIMTKDVYDSTVKPAAQFGNGKTKKLLKPEYKNGYLGDVGGGEAGPNLIDIGRDLGVKLGQKYPGDVEFLKMLDNYRGHKSFLVPQLATDTKAGRRHVGDAMTGKYFAAPLVGVSGAYAVSDK